jgi:alpha-galactosidase
MQRQAHLSNGGMQIYLEEIDGALVVKYWGRELNGKIQELASDKSIPNSDFDETQISGINREHSRGFLGYPTISGHRFGKDWSTKFALDDLTSDKNKAKAVLIDATAKLKLEYRFELDEFGILLLCASLENQGTEYCLNEFAYWLPLPDRAVQTLDFAGRWSNERNPQRREIQIGRWIRDSREGKTGHNATIGEIALTNETNFATGEAWAVSLAWSGNHQYQVEKNPDGYKSIAAGEIFAPGEVILKSGETYKAPALLAAYSMSGLDGLAEKFHTMLRARTNHPKRSRPLTLNLWEAIYFDHSEEKVKSLIDIAASIGVERVVLDDGWFGARRNDKSGLGDWQISKDIWPNGLKPISGYAADKGIEFGLWFEGEMVNPDSNVYREHPEWILQEAGRTPPTWRHQLVLNLANPEAYKYVLQATHDVISECKIKYIKWDHNRILIDAGANGRAEYRNQVLAIYKLFAELKNLNPGLEIESCASGGGRIDLGMVDYVDRFWVSDNNDALSRQMIQRWTAQFLPPELLGSHIGPSPSHQTGRELALSFRAATALIGHSGIEWDISKLSGEELANLKGWIDYYKTKRELIHTGKLIRIDYPDSSHNFYGVTSEKESIFIFAQLTPTYISQLPNLRFRGLAANAKYQVKVANPAGKAGMMLIKAPNWIEAGAEASGDLLQEIGLPSPILQPAQALIIEVIKLT